MATAESHRGGKRNYGDVTCSTHSICVICTFAYVSVWQLCEILPLSTCQDRVCVSAHECGLALDRFCVSREWEPSAPRLHSPGDTFLSLPGLRSLPTTTGRDQSPYNGCPGCTCFSHQSIHQFHHLVTHYQYLRSLLQLPHLDTGRVRNTVHKHRDFVIDNMVLHIQYL